MTENIETSEDVKAPAKAEAKKAPAKKAASKKAAAPKADAAAPAKEEKQDARNLYLPALPEGFEYTNISITGPDGAAIAVSLDAGPGIAAGAATLAYEGVNLNRKTNLPSMKEAVKAAAKAAGAMATVAKREAELAALRSEAFDL